MAQTSGKPGHRCIAGLCALLLAACSSSPPAAKEEPRPAAQSTATAEPVRPAASEPSEAPAPQFAVRVVLAPDQPLEAGDYVWEPEGVPAGPLRVVVDLEARKLYVYRSGVEIGRAHIIYGDDDKPTPTGVFPILQKNIDHVSNLYNAPMPYMLRLTWDGIAIHGSIVDDAYATHGCIGIPDDFAALLFAEAKLGDLVMVTNGWEADAPASAATQPLGQATTPTI